MLSHQMPDGTEKPIGFASRTLSAAEKNYSQMEKEGLACVYGVKKFHTYLFGHPFLLYTDHKPLMHLFHAERAVSSTSVIQNSEMGIDLGNVRVHDIVQTNHCTWKCRCFESSSTPRATQGYNCTFGVDPAIGTVAGVTHHCTTDQSLDSKRSTVVSCLAVHTEWVA